jgi:hypothetical protein
VSTIRDDLRRLLGDPAGFAADITPDAVSRWTEGHDGFAAARAAASKRPLRSAQVAAWNALAGARVGLLLGPPGTGKSELLAWMAAGYLHAHRAAGEPCRVLVAGFTRESMGNLVDKFASIAREHLSEVPIALLGNAPDGGLDPDVRHLPLPRPPYAAARSFLKAPHLACAINGWQLAKLIARAELPGSDGHTAPLFDLVLIDEASQMPLSQGLLSLAGLAPHGRVVVAGDDRQLGPVRATFDALAGDGRALGRSFYAFLKSGGVPEAALEETFRLNAPLTAFPAAHTYQDKFSSAVPDRRLALRGSWEEGLEDWERLALDPELPVVVMLHDGPPAGSDNPFERHVIRRLVGRLVDRLAPVPPGHLWTERLAVVTPHRAQNAALREELRAVPGCEHARVETIDRFQGRERDVVIAGYTVADVEFAQQEAGFLFGAERLNVTVTRARHKLVLLASRRLLEVLPPDDEVFDHAWLLREYIYECAFAGAHEVRGSDGRRHVVELRARAFDSSAVVAFASRPRAAAAPPPPRVRRLTYEAPSVEGAEIVHRLGLSGTSYTYITATAALKAERTREGVFASHQRDARTTDPVLRFDEVLRERFPSPVLSRTRERIYLLRAIKRALASDAKVENFVRRDVASWLDALAELAHRGIDLTRDPAPAEILSTIVGETLRTLQRAHRDERPSAALRTFEEAAYELLQGRVELGEVVVMEGFTFLTPLQRRFVDACLAQGTSVYFVHPYCDTQRRAFAVLDRTYADFDGALREHVSDVAAPADDLALLRRDLFADAVPAAGQGASVTLQAFPHRHDEVAACVARIAAYAREDPRTTFAIVTRSLREFESLIREQARVQGLEHRIGTSPRRLLLTPVGRFALTLFQIRPGDELRMRPEQFEAMLASGWLGLDRQRTVDLFAAVRPQVFELCETRASWVEAFDRLDAMASAGVDPRARLPSHLVSAAVLNRWRSSFDDIDILSTRLFAGPPDKSIGGRVRQLLDEIERLDAGNLRRAEREIVLRIRDALAEVAQREGGMEVTGSEFGEVLNGLVKEYDQPTGADDAPPAAGSDAAGEQPEPIWLTTPEGIDSHPRDVVFYLAADDQRVPRAAPDPWPLFEDNVARAHELERYLFLAVVRAAGRCLHLSYAHRGEGADYAPSIYLREAARALGMAIDAVPRVAPSVAAVTQGADERPAAVARREYALHELAIATLCPFRYRLERIDDRARVCRDAFHLGFAAQAHWLDRAYARAVHQKRGSAADLEAHLLGAMKQVAGEVRESFPTIRAHAWSAVEGRVRKSLRNTANFPSGSAQHAKEVQPAPSIAYVVDGSGGPVSVRVGITYQLRDLQVPRPITEPVLYREWMIPALNNDGNDAGATSLERVGGRHVFRNLGRATGWWARAVRIAFGWEDVRAKPHLPFRASVEKDHAEKEQQVRYLVRQVEGGHFPKHLGDHCRVCPVRSLCLEVEE